MKEIRILHCADLHIGALAGFLGSKSEERRSEVMMALDRIASYAHKENIPLVLIAGDLFHSLHIEKRFISGALSTIAAAPGIEFVLAAGNHDPLCDAFPLCGIDLPSNLHLLDGEDCCVEFQNLGTRVYGRSLRPGTDMGRPRFTLETDDSFINIMCLHGDTTSGSDYNRITEDFIANCGMDYVALGHIHKRSELSRAGNVYYAYSGCPEGQGFDEDGERGIYSVTVSKTGCSAEFIPICRRMHLTTSVDISDYATTSDAVDGILSVLSERYGTSFRDHLYKISLRGTRTDGIGSISEIKTRLSDVLYYVKVKDNTSPFIDIDTLVRERSLRGIFVRRMKEMIDASEGAEREKAEQALIMGLSAFEGEVIFDENN